MRATPLLTLLALLTPCAIGQVAERQLTKLEREWNDAEVKKDFALIDRVLADDYTDTQPEGGIVTKAQTLASLKSGEDVITSCALSNMKVRVYGDAAVVLYLYDVKEKFQGKDVSGSYQITDTWVKRQGAWLLVASHASRISKP